MVEPRDTLQIENVVASTQIDQELDLEALVDDLAHAQYDPDQFPGLVYRTDEPRSTCLIFRSGKIVSTGATGVQNVHDVIENLFDVLRELGLRVPDEPDVGVQNIVTSGDLGHQLNLNAIAIGLGLEDVEYEPEQFPGLVYRPEETNTVILLFGSGKIVITGGKRPNDAEDTIDVIETRLDELGLLDST